jgi:hypothetical protein
VEAFKQHYLTEDQPAPPFHLLATRLDLAADVDELIHDIAAQLPGVECACIVLDTLNRSLGGSESKDEDMSAYIAACDKVRETFHCSVIVIHHCGIEGTRPRGHTSLSGAADAQIAVKRDDAKNIVASIEYMKDGPDEEEFVSRLVTVTVGQDEDEEDITSCIIEALDIAPQRAAKQPKAAKLAAGARVAGDTLRKAIERNPHQPPSSNYIPQNKQVTLLDSWRRMHYEALGSDMATDAKRQDFYRARSQLQAAAQIGIHGDYVWLV